MASKGYESDASVGSRVSARSAASTQNSELADGKRDRSRSPCKEGGDKPRTSFRQRRKQKDAAVAKESPVGKGRPQKTGPKFCTFGRALNKPHNSDEDCPVLGSGVKRMWGDYTKDGRPRCGVCKCCKNVHVLLFPSLTQKELQTTLSEDEEAKQIFEKGQETWTQKQKSKIKSAQRNVEPEKPDDSEETKEWKRRRIAFAASDALQEPDQPKESAHTRTVKSTRASRRGQLVRRTVWEKDNPGQVPADADIEWRQSRRPELKGQELEYVKVYKDRDEDRLDFSEEEADEVVRKKTVDDGTCILHADQVRCVIDAASRVQNMN